MEYLFKSKWDENTDIERWRKDRIELNKIIDAYNNWQIDFYFDQSEAIRVLALIEYGKQTIGSKDGGSGYWEELDEMEKFIRSKNEE